MTTATMSDRLRQIAILISSVDSSAARQILLQLPTDTARQIRHLSTRLGEVSAEEKRRVLIDFNVRQPLPLGLQQRLRWTGLPRERPLKPLAMIQPVQPSRICTF